MTFAPVSSGVVTGTWKVSFLTAAFAGEASANSASGTRAALRMSSETAPGPRTCWLEPLDDVRARALGRLVPEVSARGIPHLDGPADGLLARQDPAGDAVDDGRLVGAGHL